MQEDIHPHWNVCGHEKIVQFLATAIHRGTVSHAYLFVGPEHVGKFTVAQEFISALLCGSGDTACYTCSHCRQIKNHIHPDFFLIERLIDEKTEKLKKDITVEQVRELKGRLQQGSFLNGYKVAVIPGAEHVNTNAANALLKVLEEPSKKTVIILITNNIKKVPQTIVSRCQVMQFLPVATEKIEQHLKDRNITNPAKLARVAAGLPGVGISFAQDQELLSQHNHYISSFLGMLDATIENRFATIEKITDWEKDDAINIKKLRTILDSWQLIIRDFLLTQADNGYIVSNIDFEAALANNKISAARIINWTQAIERARLLIQQNINAKTILENLILSL